MVISIEMLNINEVITNNKSVLQVYSRRKQGQYIVVRKEKRKHVCLSSSLA